MYNFLHVASLKKKYVVPHRIVCAGHIDTLLKVEIRPIQL